MTSLCFPSCPFPGACLIFGNVTISHLCSSVNGQLHLPAAVNDRRDRQNTVFLLSLLYR